MSKQGNLMQYNISRSMLTLIFMISGCSVICFNAVASDLRNCVQSGVDVASNNKITEYPMPWAGEQAGSTHELIFQPNSGDFAWVTGQNYDALAKVTLATGAMQAFQLPANSGPHGVAFDEKGQFWVSLEFSGKVVRIDDMTGEVLEEIDVQIYPEGSAPINVHPHAITVGADGQTVWFTGKKTSTIGKINPDKTVEHFQLDSLGAVPIYLVASPDGNVWGTELQGNKILKITPAGVVTEYDIPTNNSRPIAVVLAPDKKSIWFTEEAGHKVAKIDFNGTISEYPVPQLQPNMILASLAFDDKGNLWTQSYVNQSDKLPAGPDYIIKLDRNILTAPAGSMDNVKVKLFQAPTNCAVFHRIAVAADGQVWFTELNTDKIGKVHRR
jgi:virginiamycin B lyase